MTFGEDRQAATMAATTSEADDRAAIFARTRPRTRAQATAARPGSPRSRCRRWRCQRPWRIRGLIEAVEQVDDEVDDDDDRRDQQDAALQRRIVAPADRLDQPFADAGPGEDRLGEHGARHQRADLQADDRDDGDERVAQRVHADDAEAAQALGACGAHIVLAQHLEHGRAGHARDRPRAAWCRARSPAGSRWCSGRAERARLVGQERVDQHEAGHGLEIVVDAGRCGPKPASGPSARRPA